MPSTGRISGPPSFTRTRIIWRSRRFLGRPWNCITSRCTVTSSCPTLAPGATPPDRRRNEPLHEMGQRHAHNALTRPLPQEWSGGMSINNDTRAFPFKMTTIFWLCAVMWNATRCGLGSCHAQKTGVGARSGVGCSILSRYPGCWDRLRPGRPAMGPPRFRTAECFRRVRRKIPKTGREISQETFPHEPLARLVQQARLGSLRAVTRLQ
jgi:hypothetical protein